MRYYIAKATTNVMPSPKKHDLWLIRASEESSALETLKKMLYEKYIETKERSADSGDDKKVLVWGDTIFSVEEIPVSDEVDVESALAPVCKAEGLSGDGRRALAEWQEKD